MVTKSDFLHFAVLLVIVIFAVFRTSDYFASFVGDVGRFFSNPLNFTWLSVTLIFYGVLFREVSSMSFFMRDKTWSGVEQRHLEVEIQITAWVILSAFSSATRRIVHMEAKVQDIEWDGAGEEQEHLL